MNDMPQKTKIAKLYDSTSLLEKYDASLPSQYDSIIQEKKF